MRIHPSFLGYMAFQESHSSVPRFPHRLKALQRRLRKLLSIKLKCHISGILSRCPISNKLPVTRRSFHWMPRNKVRLCFPGELNFAWSRQTRPPTANREKRTFRRAGIIKGKNKKLAKTRRNHFIHASRARKRKFVTHFERILSSSLYFTHTLRNARINFLVSRRRIQSNMHLSGDHRVVENVSMLNPSQMETLFISRHNLSACTAVALSPLCKGSLPPTHTNKEDRSFGPQILYLSSF